MLQSKILSTMEAAYGFHALSGSPLFLYASRASKVIFVLGATRRIYIRITAKKGFDFLLWHTSTQNH